MIRGLWAIYGYAAGLPTEESYRNFITPPRAQPGEGLLTMAPRAMPVRSRAAAWRTAGRAARQMIAAFALVIAGPARRADVAMRCRVDNILN